MPTLTELLADPNAQIELIVKGTYIDELDIEHIEWVSQTGWDDEIDGEAGAYIPPLLTSTLRINHKADPLEALTSFDTFGDIELSNNHLDYAGRYDLWWKYSVDGLDWTVYAVGKLSNGARVELSDVITTPLFKLRGISIPEVGSDTCHVRCRDWISSALDSALQPVTYSPPALSFPGTVAGVVDLGDNLNITGAQSLSVWVYLTDTAATMQYILHKDSGTTGYYLAVGLVGSGTIEGGVEITVRGQSPATTTTAAGVLRPFRWHRIDISIAATTRRIDIDGTTAITTSAITGTPLSSTTSLTIGRSLNGRVSRVLYWTNTRTNAVMSGEGRTPITGAEASLREAFLFHEGIGATVASIKAGSVLTGALGVGVLWDTSSWHYESILGQYEPYVLGTVPRVPVTWIDPPKQIGQVSRGSIALLAELQSNHNVVSTANYTVGLTNGTVTVTSGALSGTYSATVTANNLWNSALLFNGTSAGANATITQPVGSKYLGVHFRCDNTSSIARIIAQWVGSGGIHLRLNSTGTLTGINILRARVANDANVEFTASIAILEGKRYSAIASLNLSAMTVDLYVNGSLAASTPVTGSFTLAPTAFSVGYRSAGPDTYFKGVIDEIVIGTVPCTVGIAESFHTLPSTSSLTGISHGWHLDDATGTNAVPFAGVTNLTLVNTTWTYGRTSAIDLARAILYDYGYLESDLDTDLWLAALNDNLADCGWFVSGGARGIDILNVILGGLGFRAYYSNGLIKIKRFEGLSGVAAITLDHETDLQAQPIEPNPADPAIYLWILTYATNNSKQDAANITGSLATSDPDRYQYGAMPHKSASKLDSSILGRFPNAEPRTRSTALLNRDDAENEAARLLAIHRHGADRKSIPVFMSVGQLEGWDEIGPLMDETDLDEGNSIVIGISLEDGIGTISIWRPSIT